MLYNLIFKLVSPNWRALCGINQKQLAMCVEETLSELEYEYQKERQRPKKVEKAIFGADEESITISVTAPCEFDIEIVKATGNPLHMFMMKQFLTSDDLADATSEICIVDVRGINNSNQRYIRDLFNKSMEKTTRDFWSLTHHPALRPAILLRLKVYILWKILLKND